MASFASGYTVDVAKLTKNSKIGFKTGLESSLKNITAQEGCFYLTSDSFRLFIGTKEGTLAPVNQGVITMDKLEEITSLSKEDVIKGAFYYSTDSNILCVHNGQGWVQINNDTRIKSTGAKVTATTGGAQVTQTINDTNNNSYTSNFKVVGGDNVTVAVDSDNIKVSAHDAEYAIAAPVATDKDITVSLTKDGNTVANPLVFTKGDNIDFTVDADGKIKISSIQDAVNNEIIKGAEFTNEEDGFKLTLSKKGNDQITATVNPVVTYGTGATSSATFKNGTLNLDVLTSTEVKELLTTELQGINALTYKEAITDSKESLPSTGVAIGDVYLQAFSGKMQGSGDGKDYDPGTLWIANGVETNGVITSELSWTCVENFSTDTVYTFKNEITEDHKWKHTVTSKAGDVTNTVEQFVVSGDNLVTVSGTGSEIQINHAPATITPTVNKDGINSNVVLYENDIVEGLSYDGAGHISAITSKKMQIPGINAQATVTASGQTITNTVNTKSATNTGFSGTATSTSTEYASQTLAISTSANSGNTAATVTLDLVWGEF